MRLRKLALAVGLASALGSNFAAALGLGEIELMSHLNQPLQAEIRLLQVDDLSESEILINLASREEFQRMGIDRPFFLTELRFEVELDAASGPVVRVTSRNPVREPYLNFLIESQWPSGRIMREYTVLLDLPVFTERQAQPVTAVSGGASARAQPGDGDVARRVSSGPGATPGDVYGPVTANDTLWNIAQEVRPGRQYSVHKTMLAIQRINPEAFINGNINLLRRGQVLRIPTANEIDSVSQQQAVSEVAYQNDQWKTGQPARTAEPADSATGESRPATPGRSIEDSGPVEGRVKVAGDEMSAARDAASVGGSASGSDGNLENELAVSLEELDRTRRENADLQGRVRDLEEQIQTMERLVEVSSRELRALQNQASEDSTSMPVSSKAAQAENSPAASVDPASEVTQPAAAAPAKVVQSSSAQDKGWLGILTDNILYIGAALVAILAAVLMLLKRKEEPEEAELAPVAAAPVAAAPVTAVAPESEPEFAEAAGEISLDDEPLLEEPPEEISAPVESQTDDVVGEADIYIAYGKFDQAEEMLVNALASDSGNDDVRLKLMEVYAETNNLAQFDENYAHIAAGADADAVARADDLRLHFADAEPPTQPAAPITAFDDSDTVENEALSEAEGEAADESGALDLVLDEDIDSAADEDFEFSLDLDEEEVNLNEETPLLADEDLELGVDSDDEDLKFDLGDESEADSEFAGFDLDEPETDLDLKSDLGEEPESEFDIDVGDFDEAELQLDLDEELDTEDLQLDVEEAALESAGPEDPTLNYELDQQELDAALEAQRESGSGTLEEGAEQAEEHFEMPSQDEVDLEALDRELGELSEDLVAEGETEAPETEAPEEETGSAVEMAEQAETPELAEVGETEDTRTAEDDTQSDDELFSAALADLPEPEEALSEEEATSEEDLEGDFDFLAETDETATKLDLARAYIDMGDHEGARDILGEVVEEGSEDQRRDAEELMSRLG